MAMFGPATGDDIGIDGFNLSLKRGTGVATYARTLSHCLRGLGLGVNALYGTDIGPRTPAALREVVFFDSLDGEGRGAPVMLSRRWWREQAAAGLPPSAVSIPVRGTVIEDTLRSRLPSFSRLSAIAQLFQMADRHFRRTRRFLRVRMNPVPAVMHWTYPLPIRLLGARNVYTIHDLVPLRLPYTTLDNKRLYYRLIQGCLRHGDAIAAVSDATRRDILGLFPDAPAERVINTYQAFDPPAGLPAGNDQAGELQRLFGLEQRGYFLFFGAIEPKKNVGRLIEAYLAADTTLPLVIVGTAAWKSEDELALLASSSVSFASSLRKRIRRIEYLPRALLLRLVVGARAVVFPSLYEGFGLPVLEAMALGTPVLTSTTSSMPEVAGEAAMLVDPYDVAALADGLRSLAADDDLCRAMGAAGPVQARRFDSDAYGDRVTALYRAAGWQGQERAAA